MDGRTCKTMLSNQLIPHSNIALGRFVTDTKHPQRRYHDPVLPPTVPCRSVRTVQHNFQETAIVSRDRTSGTHLTELLSAFRSARIATGASVAATSATWYSLLQWDDVFRDACAQEATRKWFLSAIEDDVPIYFVVGYRTFFNPSVVELNSRATAVEGSVQAPVTTVVAANFVPGAQLGGVLDPGVSASVERTAERARQFEADGEMVFAVQYCRVVLKWYDSKSVDKSTLGKTRWKIYWGVRGAEETGNEDVVDVELDGDAELEDGVELKEDWRVELSGE